MIQKFFNVGRRSFLAGLAASTALPLVAMPGRALAQEPRAGGTLRTPAWPAPSILNSAISTAGPETFIGPKFFDGLLGYDFGMVPKPSLATSWEMSEDGKRVTFNLREGVKWHDGADFTSHDVAFTFLQVLKVMHGRGRTTFGGLLDVETPDPLTAIFVLERAEPGDDARPRQPRKPDPARPYL
ncbi:ABC transporter substrate-binding protein [Pararhodobacter sp.]|uniref:ABC transporter substrate-binding protein n=1 Tax=Pararhodobacter sp. TaxID=2127056 RepID=UPI002AFE7C95|nr:ABC transporter substrate-binding protein [Pararhodobacter sp.]